MGSLKSVTEGPILVLAGFEQLVLLGFLRLYFLALLLIAQSHEPVFLAPPIRPIVEFTSGIAIRLRRRLPFCPTQLLDQSGRLARRDHEPGVELFVSLDRFPAVEP